jgi:type I restriction enzyme M protein
MALLRSTRTILKRDFPQPEDIRLALWCIGGRIAGMAHRHRFDPRDIPSVVERLQELVVAHSGEDPFEEIFKMLVAKMCSETLPLPAWNFWTDQDPRTGREKFDALLARAAKTWPGVLERDFGTRLQPDHLLECLRVLSDVNLTGAELEVIDHAFEFLVSHTSKGAKGQYFTPRHVIECCIRIIDPKPNETVFDPACGSGGFLFHALKHVERVHGIGDLSEYSHAKLWGADFDIRASKVARALLILAGAERANIFRVNSLVQRGSQTDIPGLVTKPEDLHLEDVLSTSMPRFAGFDVIVTNPPFAGEITDAGTLAEYALARSGRRMERDVLFIERCIALLRPGGRMAIVVPHNKVGASSWEYLRRWLLSNARVVSVLGLERETFLPHTHQKTSVLFCRKRQGEVKRVQPEEILFQVSSRSGKDSKGKLVLRPNSAVGRSAWDKIDHDFSEVVQNFQSFANSQLDLW